MDKSDIIVKRKTGDDTSTDEKDGLSKSKVKNRGRKRKREDSDSSTDLDDVLPDNALEVEKNLHASAIKNNLDDESVKKILKKVVTNDHVLALVKIREKEEAACTPPETSAPKLTRAKVKELMKVSPKSAPWSLELTPIKHIPVKTRPEVKALIAQELPEDEDDEEYQPTNEDVPSDDDQTLESCSDVDSQPRTPATPTYASPRVQKDGPFKVPQLTPTARRKLVLNEVEEEATIALRTRSKINLSATTIEHIESNFVPPDDIPAPRDEEWDQFLSGVFDPTGFREEDDLDETDPEYNVAADPDANEEDDLESSLLRISKKELNDLVTELFSILPEAAVADELADSLAKNVLTDSDTQLSSSWGGKQEIISDDETESTLETAQERDSAVISKGKSEPKEPDHRNRVETRSSANSENMKGGRVVPLKIGQPLPKRPCVTDVTVEERSVPIAGRPGHSPPRLLRHMRSKAASDQVVIHVEEVVKIEILPEQVQILQQQLRQHVQLATSNFLQLFVNPQHWSLAPTYKQYLEQLESLLESNPNSVVNVCNLKPAVELARTWEEVVSEDTPENQEMVEFIQKEADRSRRRFKSNSLYVGEFPETFKRVVANSSVFLYPYLLPAMPYRSEIYRKYGYRICEDELIAIGLDQFWQYLEDNPQFFKRKVKPNPRTRVGLNATVALVSKYMFPWMAPKLLHCHIGRVRREKDNPVHLFFEKREIRPVKHKLLPFNPDLTLYEQPEHEMPLIWVRYLAKSSKRFRNQLHRRKHSGLPPPDGVPIEMGSIVEVPKKNPLPIDFTKTIVSNRCNVIPKSPRAPLRDKFDVQFENLEKRVSAEKNIDFEGKSSKETGNVFSERIYTRHTVTKDTVRNNDNEPKGFHQDSKNSEVKSNFITIDSTSVNINDKPNNLTKNMFTIDAGKLIFNSVSAPKKHDSPEKTTVKVHEISEETTGKSSTNAPRSNLASTVKENREITNKTVTAAPLIARNLFKVVETSTGAFLVPLTVLQNTHTVNSINGPISSTFEKNVSVISNDMPEQSKIASKTKRKDDNNDHCKCCLILRKICKVKQTCITDFFNPKRVNKCQCSDRKYPKISKRLRMLVNNFKSKSWCVHRELQSTLSLVKREHSSEVENNLEVEDQSFENPGDKECSLDDIAFVTTFQLKLINRTNIARNNYLKKRVNNIFSKFDVEDGDVIRLTEELFKALEVDLVDLYKEFVGFLTAEQAEKIDKFKDYFTQSCVGDLVKRIEAEIADGDTKRAVLSRLSAIFFDTTSTSCEMCSSLLDALPAHPRLARHVFALFPHRAVVKEDIVRTAVSGEKHQQQAAPSDSDKQRTESRTKIVTQENPETNPTKEFDSDVCDGENALTICENDTLTQTLTVNYESDDSDSDSERNRMSVVEAMDESTAAATEDDTLITVASKSNETHSSIPYKSDESALDTLTVTKTEADDQGSESTEMSALIMSEDEPVKSEPVEWNREEDKVVLQVLLQQLSPGQRQGKPIMEILDEKNLYQVIFDKLTEKSLSDIKERVVYLLEILVMNE